MINGLTETNYKALYRSLEVYLHRINLRTLFGQQFLSAEYESLLAKGYPKLAAKYHRQLENYAVIEQLAQHIECHSGDEMVDIRTIDREAN